ncbi:MAG: GntR family transcriptional regulator [Thermomicrobiales bacterium]|nr:GntR family transcriptional regulator [Thermomicrobiales bacterium]
MNTIDRSLPIATYFQIARDLQSRIGSGEWNATRKLPSEAQLAHDYGVSRMTVRQALAELDKDGIVRRRQGVGTFIGEAADRHGRVTMTMSSTMIVRRALVDMGYDPEMRLTQAKVIPVPSEDIARALQIRDDEMVAFVERSFIVDGKGLVLSHSFLPHRLVEGILDRPLVNDSIHETLSHRYGIYVERSQRWIEAVRATDDEAQALSVEVGSPQLLFTSLFLDTKSQPVEYVRTVWPGDSIRIFLEQRVELNQV